MFTIQFINDDRNIKISTETMFDDDVDWVTIFRKFLNILRGFGFCKEIPPLTEENFISMIEETAKDIKR